MTISELFIYPVKSLGGIAVTNVQLTDRGFQYDRRWMLIDENNYFITQRKHTNLALLQTAIGEKGIDVFHRHQPKEKIVIPYTSALADLVNVQVWDDVCTASTVSTTLDEWFSEQLKQKCRLVYMPNTSNRFIDSNYRINENDITSFSDGYPVLMIGQASLNDLNSRLEAPVPMNRFRPNIVFTGGQPYEEDTMKVFNINGISFYGVKLCSRCVLTTIDQQTGKQQKEPLKTLATYRTHNHKIFFGQNVIYQGLGQLKIGDSIHGTKQIASLLSVGTMPTTRQQHLPTLTNVRG
jgi:hypothetical protein